MKVVKDSGPLWKVYRCQPCDCRRHLRETWRSRFWRQNVVVEKVGRGAAEEGVNVVGTSMWCRDAHAITRARTLGLLTC